MFNRKKSVENCCECAVKSVRGTDWVQAPTLAQPGSPGEQRGVLVDNDAPAFVMSDGSSIKSVNKRWKMTTETQTSVKKPEIKC